MLFMFNPLGKATFLIERNIRSWSLQKMLRVVGTSLIYHVL